MSNQILSHGVKDGESVVLHADRTSRYTLHFHAIGMQVEFVMLAGQSFKISAEPGMPASKVSVDMADIDPEGLQLVPPKAGA